MPVMELQVTESALKSKVLETLQRAPLRPTDLVSSLRREALQMDIESALSDLLDEGTVIFGSDRLLRSMAIPAH